MNLFSASFLLTTALALTALPGCGGGGASEEEVSFTGLDGKLKLNSLSSQQLVEICLEAKNVLWEIFESREACRYIAVLKAGESSSPVTEEECRETENLLFESKLGWREWGNGLQMVLQGYRCEPGWGQGTDCTAPVALFERCFIERKESVEKFLAQASCSSIEPDLHEKFSDFTDLPQPSTPSCIELDRQCAGDFYIR